MLESHLLILMTQLPRMLKPSLKSQSRDMEDILTADPRSLHFFQKFFHLMTQMLHQHHSTGTGETSMAPIGSHGTRTNTSLSTAAHAWYDWFSYSSWFECPTLG